MRRRSRTRRILKWTGLVLCVQLLAIWAVGAFWIVRYDWGTDWVGFGLGRFVYAERQLAWSASGWRAFRTPPRFGIGWPKWGRAPRFVSIPIGMVFTALVIPTAILWRRDRTIRAAHCRRCGYDLTGNVSGVCPECGMNVPPEDR